MRRSQDGYGRIKWALLILSRPKSLYYRIRNRTINRLLDIRAVLAGSCNATTWDPKRSTFRGGYPHWRCARRRGHYPVTPHRFNNYVWSVGGGTQYDPLPVAGIAAYKLLCTGEIPFQRFANGRKPSMRLSQARATEKAMALAEAARREERRANGVRY